MSKSWMNLLWTGAIGSVSLLAPPTRAATVPIIANGSFEAPISSAAFVTLPAGSTSLIGWTIAPSSANLSPTATGSVDVIRGYWQPAQGLQSLDLDGSGPGNQAAQISQTVNLPTVPSWYDLRFSLSGNPQGPPTTKTLKVSAVGSDVSTAFQVFTYDTTAMGNTLTNMKWVTENYWFHVSNPATQSHMTLVFDSLSAGIFGPALDNVSLHIPPILGGDPPGDPPAVPAPPATWAGAALLAALGLARALTPRRAV